MWREHLWKDRDTLVLQAQSHKRSHPLLECYYAQVVTLGSHLTKQRLASNTPYHWRIS